MFLGISFLFCFRIYRVLGVCVYGSLVLLLWVIDKFLILFYIKICLL